jgi:Zn-dependent peptidase ImmA (M78 family)
MTQTELAVRASVSQGLIAQIERGLKAPSDEVIEKISRFTGFPTQFFVTDPAVEFPGDSLLFRSYADTRDFEVSQAARYAELIAEIASALLNGNRPVRLKMPLLRGQKPEFAARATRTAFGIPPNEPIANLVRAVEQSGILVFAVPDELRGRDAFSLWWEDRPVLAITSVSSGARLRTNVAHELGHLVLQHGKLTSASEERDAYLFAGELLAPGDALRHEITTPVTLSSIAHLKPRWKVSIQALIRRTKDLSIISDRQYAYLNAQVSAKGWKKKEPGEFATEKPRLLRQICEDVRGLRADQLASEIGFSRAFVNKVIEAYEPKTTTGQNIDTSHKVTAFRRR